MVAIFLIIFIKALETMGLNIARTHPALWPTSYLSTIAGFLIVWALLYMATRPYLFRRRPRVSVS